MKRHALTFVLTAALAALAATPFVRGAADSTITGKVTATGLSTNANAVVYVEQAAGAFKPPAEPARLDQRNLKFVPEVLPVLVGTTVKFLNGDSVAHNVFSPDHEKYNLGTWPQGQSKDYTFAKCAKFPCAYAQLCLIHPEMQGFIIVLQNPYFAVTDAAGNFTIKDVPAGPYKVGVWHQKLKAQPKPVVVEAGKPATVDFTLGR